VFCRRRRRAPCVGALHWPRTRRSAAANAQAAPATRRVLALPSAAPLIALAYSPVQLPWQLGHFEVGTGASGLKVLLPMLKTGQSSA
jgi:hypothetical protein